MSIAIATRSPVRSILRLPTSGFSGATVANQTIQFGADTLASAGGAKAVASDGTEVDILSVNSTVSGTGTGWTAAGGRLYKTGATPGTTSLPVLRCTTSLGVIDITIATTTNTYSVSTAAELLAVCALGAGTVSGKNIKMRKGEYAWDDTAFSSRSFTSTVTVSPHDAQYSAIFVGTTNNQLTSGQNITFDSLRFEWRINYGVADGYLAAIALDGTSSNLRFTNCDFNGYFIEKLAQLGTPFGSGDYGWRGMLGNTTTHSVGSGNVYIENNIFRGTYRCLNLRGGRTAGPAAGKFIIRKNSFYDFTLDAIVVSGDMRQGLDIHFNKIYNPISIVSEEFQVTSVDTVANTLTVPKGRFTTGTYTINIGPSTTTPPGGLNFPGVGASNDYVCTVTVGVTDAVISGWSLEGVSQDITSAGTNVWIRKEPGHADFIQLIPNSISGDHLDPTNVSFIGNEMLGKLDSSQSWPQMLFAEDVAFSGFDNYYTKTVIAGNVGYTGVLNGITLYAAKDSIVADNTCLGPSDAAVSVPQISTRTSWTATPSGNVLYNNAAGSISSSNAEDAIAANHPLTPVGYSGSGLFAGTGGYAPTTIEGMRAAFSRTDLNGVIDYVNGTYDLPSANSCTFPDFTDVTGVAVGTVGTVASPVQITSILNGQGSASAYGALVSVAGPGSPEFRITSDIGGSSVVTDWTSTPAVITSGQYLWVRLTASASYSTAVSCTVRVGTGINSFQVTSAAAGVGDPILEAGSTTGGVDGATNMTVTMVSGTASGDILVLLYLCDNASLPTTPAGWTQRAAAQYTTGTPTMHAAVYTKTAGASETDFTVSHGSSVLQGYRLLRISGASAVEAAAASSVAAWQPDPPNLAPSWGSDTCMWIAAYAERRSALRTVTTYPTGYVQNQVAARAIDGASLDLGFGLATKIATASSDNPAAYALSGTTAAVAFTIALRT